MDKIEKVKERGYDPNGERSFNQLTSHTYDTCEYENSLRLGSKPMKYYVNQLNTPQTNSFKEFTNIGNQRVNYVQNEYERPLPTRLNPLYQSYILPYSTTPNLGSQNPSMEYSETESNLRFGTDIRAKKSAVALSEVDYNRFAPNVDAVTVQNAGQFQFNGGRGIDKDGYFDYSQQNNVIFANGAWPRGGISTRDQLRNYSEVNGC